MNDAEATSLEIIEEWIAGRGKRPVTWKTLTEILCDTELTVLAGEIEDVKLHRKKEQSSKLKYCNRTSLYISGRRDYIKFIPIRISKRYSQPIFNMYTAYSRISFL